MIAQLHLLYDTNKYKQLLDEYPHDAARAARGAPARSDTPRCQC